MADHLRDATKKMDFISREAASDKLYKLPCKIDEDGYRWVLSRDVTHMIDEIPAADVRTVIRGTWIETAPINEETGVPLIVKGPHLKCSNCGSVEFRRNFCPNCGADMRDR
jgi:hypothetical protein